MGEYTPTTDEADKIVAAHGGVTEVVRAALDDYLCDADCVAAILAAHDAEVAARTLREAANSLEECDWLDDTGPWVEFLRDRALVKYELDHERTDR